MSEWNDDLVRCFEMAVRILDLEERTIQADNPGAFSALNHVIANVAEETIVLKAYQLMTQNGYQRQRRSNEPVIEREAKYEGYNKRSDLLIRGRSGQGKQFDYVEVKAAYGSNWNYNVKADTKKLHDYGGRRGKYLLLYRLRTTSKQTKLEDEKLLNPKNLELLSNVTFNLSQKEGSSAFFDIGLYKVISSLM